jgi:hypothetical protein
MLAQIVKANLGELRAISEPVVFAQHVPGIETVPMLVVKTMLVSCHALPASFRSASWRVR